MITSTFCRAILAKASKVSETVYRPNPEAGAVYDKIYAEYRRLYDHFGRGGNNVMKTLKAIREEV